MNATTTSAPLWTEGLEYSAHGVTWGTYPLRTIRSFFQSARTTSIWLLCVFSGSSVTARHNELVDQLCFPSIDNAAARTA